MIKHHGGFEMNTTDYSERAEKETEAVRNIYKIILGIGLAVCMVLSAKGIHL
jgi:hypothetical protein